MTNHVSCYTKFLLYFLLMASCTIVSSESTDSSLVKLRVPFRNDKQNENYLSRIILVIDRSGSMCGGKILFFK